MPNWKVSSGCRQHEFTITKVVEAATSLEAKQQFFAKLTPKEDALYLKHFGHSGNRKPDKCEVING